MLAGAGLILGERGISPVSVQTLSQDGLVARSMAMHVHSSFSEGMASMEAQLFQAAHNAVDVLWWTDHEWKMRARNFKHEVHFTALTGEQIDGTKPWNWVRTKVGTLTAASTGGIAPLSSPTDSVTTGSLHVLAQSTSTTLAKLGYAVDGLAPKTQRGNAYGQVWTLDVLPTSIASTAFLELLVTLSYHPAQAGRPAGQYQISYRFGGANAAGSRVASGLLGVVTLPANVGQWNTVAVTMSDDIAVLWPDMNPQDFSTYQLSFLAASTGGVAEGYFDDLRISRPYATGDVPLQIQQSIGSGYAAQYPGVAQRQGLEVSFTDPHVNWFGGAVSIPTFIAGKGQTWQQFLMATITTIHAGGGLASYNHPYGTSTPNSVQAQSAQDAGMSKTATSLLTNKALGVDIIEVGYPRRAGYDLAHHVGLWDTLSRNAMFLTGNGVNDDHPGTNWFGTANNWVTWVWSATDSEADLLAAMKAGRAWTGSLTTRCSLDLLVDGACPMGSVSVSSLTQRTLRVIAAGMPSGGSVQVLRGGVDYAGSGNPVPNLSRIASYLSSDLASGSVDLAVDTTTSCFVRLSVLDSSGAVVAVSNPVWMLREIPASGIPTARQF